MMERKKSVLHFVLICGAIGILSFGCNKERSDFILSGLNIGTIDLNGTQPPDKITANPILVARFNYNIDTASVNAGNVSLVQEYDQDHVSMKIKVEGNTITVTPIETLGTGMYYDLVFSDRLRSVGGQQLTETSRSFSTEGTFAPRGALAFWNFDGNALDKLGTFSPAESGIVAINYTSSRNAQAGRAADFDGERSIIEIPKGLDLINTHNFSLSFWMKTNSASHFDAAGKPAGYYVMGLGAYVGFQFEIASDFSWCNFTARYDVLGSLPVSQDLMFYGDGQTRDNGGWQGCVYSRNLTGSSGVVGMLKDKWASVAIVFDSLSRSTTMYINGLKMKTIDFNLWPAKDVSQRICGLKYDGDMSQSIAALAFGFSQSSAGNVMSSDPRQGYRLPTANHYKGQLDDIRIYHKPLTELEVQMMYDSER